MATHTHPVIIEACVESLAEAMEAANKGADRIELCANLDEDGLTPSVELITSVQNAIDIPIKVMIRPRSGDFVYTDGDKELITKDIRAVMATGINEIVYGSLADGRLDIEDLKRVYALASPRTMTIHKAIDASIDPMKDVLELVKWSHLEQVNLSILSSGQAATAIDGAFRLKRMQQLCGDEVELIVAGKVTPRNLNQLKALIPAPSFHGRQIL